MAHAVDLSHQDILDYLSAHERKDLLRFITCGSVDDGKSTLIGRLLYESKLIYEDQLAALDADSRKHGTQGEELDLALLVDGLAAEREQGITIDVAYRFFSTERRKFIVADTPGHEQYTRNMVTGASTADVAVILVDARKGVLTQTRRHSYIVSLLGIRQVVLAVNKMDGVGYAEDTFNAIVADYLAFARQVGLDNVVGIPVSALRGDNILTNSPQMPWYRGSALLPHLESVEVEQRTQHLPFRLPVQWVNRPNSDFRGFAGQIAGGRVNVGDRIRALPSGAEAAGIKDRHLRWRPAPRGGRPVGDRDAGSGDRHLARGSARGQRRAGRGRRPVRSHADLDARATDAARPPVPDEGRHAHRQRHAGRARDTA